MDYIDYRSYFDDFDVSILTRKEYHEYRKKYRFLTLIGRYLNSCILEFNRIDDWAGLQQSLGTRVVSGLEASKYELVFSDFHFLLISMDKCYKYEQQLYLLFNRSDKATELADSSCVCSIRRMRNTLEHSEENINTDSRNDFYELPDEFLQTGWSWLEYQLLSFCNGVFGLNNLTLTFSNDMFDHIINHYKILIDIFYQEVSNLT